jgi:sporulation integral membrane protein YtvI
VELKGLFRFHKEIQKGGNKMKSWMERSNIVRWFISVALITAGVYLGFRYLLPLVFPFLVSYFLAWIIKPVAESLYHRFKIPRIIGGSFSLILLVAVFGTAFYMLIRVLIRQTFELVKNIPVYLNIIADKLDVICRHCDGLVGLNFGTIRSIVDENIIVTVNMVKSNIMPKITKHSISFTVDFITFIGIVLIILVAAVLIVKELPEFHKRFDNNSLYKDIHKVTAKLADAGTAYLRSQLIIMSIVGVISIIGLTILKSHYAVLLGLGIAILDALPILGSAMVYIPWAMISLFNGDILVAAILFSTFLICQVIREILEPKLIGNRIGIKPLYTLISMYVGLKLFSFAGFFLGPIGLLIIITVYKVVNDKTEAAKIDSQAFYDED